jgi:hypothetical protein
MRGMDESYPVDNELLTEPPLEYPAVSEIRPETPLQFGIRDLLIVQTVCAVCFGLFVMVGIFAVMAILIATVIASFVQVKPERAKVKRFCIDLLGGVILPVLCLAYDPFVFREHPEWQAFGYIFIGMQMVVLVGWMTLGWSFRRGSALIAGFLAVGAGVSGIMGVLLALFSVVGLFYFGIGILGFTPFLTCVVFARNARQAMRQAAADGQPISLLLSLLRALLAVVIPALLYGMAGPWIEQVIKRLPWPHDWFNQRLVGLW